LLFLSLFIDSISGDRTEGIFRISPEGSKIDELKEQLEKGPPLIFNSNA
jgi:hypothetical protein